VRPLEVNSVARSRGTGGAGVTGRRDAPAASGQQNGAMFRASPGRRRHPVTNDPTVHAAACPSGGERRGVRSVRGASALLGVLGVVAVMLLAGCGSSSSSPHCEPSAQQAPGSVVERRIVVERAGVAKLDALSLFLVRCDDGRTVALDPKHGTLFTSLDDFRHRNRLLGPKDQILVPRDLTSTAEKPEYVQVSGHVDDSTPVWARVVVAAGSVVIVLAAAAVVVVLVRRRRRRRAADAPDPAVDLPGLDQPESDPDDHATAAADVEKADVNKAGVEKAGKAGVEAEATPGED